MTAQLLDTSILVGAIDAARHSHKECRELLQSGARLVVAAQSCREFLSVVSRAPAQNGLGLSPVAACDALDSLLLWAPYLPETQPVLATQLQLIRRFGCSGRAVHDAGIVAAALVHGIPTLLTTDAQVFHRYASLLTISRPPSGA